MKHLEVKWKWISFTENRLYYTGTLPAIFFYSGNTSSNSVLKFEFYLNTGQDLAYVFNRKIIVKYNVIAYQRLVWLTPSERMRGARTEVAVGILLKK
jgi:hypothetical protein